MLLTNKCASVAACLTPASSTHRLVLAIAALNLGAFLVVVAGPAQAQSKRPPPQVTVATVVSTSFVDRVEALGTLQANEAVTITATVTERIVSLGFDDGDRVEAGHILAELQRSREQAQLAEAKAELAEARQKLKRARDLRRRGVASAAELTDLQRAYSVAQARLEVVQVDIDYRIIRAPFNGRVGIRRISAGSTVRPGDAIVELVDDSKMKLDFSVPGPLFSVIKPGVSIEATTRAYPGEVFTGVVAAVDAKVDPVSRAVLIRAIIPNEGRRLLPGLLMEVDLLVNERSALTVPEESLILSGTDRSVFVIESADAGLRARRQLVKTGARRVGEVEILDGLKAGDRVVKSGGIKLRPGAAVRIQGQGQPADGKPSDKKAPPAAES